MLADRGLADAIRALALDAPLPVELELDLPGEVKLPAAAPTRPRAPGWPGWNAGWPRLMASWR